MSHLYGYARTTVVRMNYVYKRTVSWVDPIVNIVQIRYISGRIETCHSRKYFLKIMSFSVAESDCASDMGSSTVSVNVKSAQRDARSVDEKINKSTVIDK